MLEWQEDPLIFFITLVIFNSKIYYSIGSFSHIWYFLFMFSIVMITHASHPYTCRVICRPRFSCLVSFRENPCFWSQKPHCQTLHCVASSTRCSTCCNFSSGWLLASLARHICWWFFRFVFSQLAYHLFTISSVKNFIIFCRINSCFILLSAILPTTFWCKWYVSSILDLPIVVLLYELSMLIFFSSLWDHS